ncbi:MAG: LLM class flavin-dependent oxidoreductase [Proteobacteria bacterium]|nr:LLM class flavin-dependent oxidoreductase [Pseudomonadota bacterium]
MATENRDDMMSIGVFFKNTGHHIASWLHPGATPDAGVNLKHYVDCAQKCERAGMDFIFFADSLAVREGAADVVSRMSQFIAYFEPITLLSALAMATERIGLAVTASTSFSEPYNIARQFASLDHISGGRAGWNIVTSGLGDIEAQNFGLQEHYEHDERYRRATEFVEVVLGLLDSWDDDAFLYDRESGRFFDPDKVRPLNHSGRYFRSRGPLNVPRPPQGYPVLFQAGSSNAGRELSAAFAEGIFSGSLTREVSAEHYADVKSRMRKYGRHPDQMRVMPGCTIFCGRTEAEARDKEEELASLIHPAVGIQYLASLTGMDLSDCSPDDPLPDRGSSKMSHSMRVNITTLAREENLSIGQLYKRLAGSHGKLTMRGTPSQIADQMAEWFESRACDGFILQPSTMPGDLDDLLELVIPELLDRGAIRDGYTGTTLRDHLGLSRPSGKHN